jgi:hypothetical protein
MAGGVAPFLERGLLLSLLQLQFYDALLFAREKLSGDRGVDTEAAEREALWLSIPFELRPVDIAFVVVLRQNLPLLKRLRCEP